MLSHFWRMQGVRARASCRALHTRVKITSAAPSSPRESPTPIALFGGPFGHFDPVVQQTLARSGFNVATVTLPGYGGGSTMSSDMTVDDVVEDVQKSLRPLAVPPIAIAHSTTCTFLQKYLESFAFAACVLVSPTPPSPAGLVRLWAAQHTAAAAAGTAATATAEEEQGHDMSADGILASLRSFTSSEAAARRWLHTRDTPAEEVAAAWARAYSQLASNSNSSGSSSGTLQGLAASASLLSKMCMEPVNLEPQPVPLLLVASAHDALVPYAHLLDTATFHGLQHSLPATLRATDVAAVSTALSACAQYRMTPSEQVAAGSGVVILSEPCIGHDGGLFTPQRAVPVLQAISQWIERRF